MDQLPPRPRAIPLSEVWTELPPPGDRTASHSMTHVREPRDRDRDREREWEIRDRERERPQYEDGWVPGSAARRDDVYVPMRDAHPPAFGRERDARDGREWTRDGRERRDERYHRAGGYAERGGWADDRARDRDRERDRFREWEREREERAIYERPREQRGWERDEWSRDREGRYGGEGYRSVHPRRQEVDHRYRSPPPPPHLRPRSPPPYVRRSPSPTFRAPRTTRSPGPHSRDGRSVSRAGGEIGAPVRKQRDDSADSRRSGVQRAREEQPAYVPRKRERSPSPAGTLRRAIRKQRTASTSPGRIKVEDEQTTVSPLTTRQEEKQPERVSPLPLPAPSESTGDRERERLREQASATWPGRQPRRPVRRPAPDAGATEGTAQSRGPAADREKPVPTGPAQRKIPQGTLDGTPPSTSNAVPANAPTGPRSAAAQPPPARLPSIPVWTRPTNPAIFSEIASLEHARPALYAEVARASAAVRWATAEADISTIELRSAEQRRVLAGQLRQQMEA